MNSKKSLLLLERFCWFSSTLLLASYAAAHLHANAGKDEQVDAFERQFSAQQELRYTQTNDDSAGTGTTDLTPPAPDMSLWSAHAKKKYDEAMKSSSEAIIAMIEIDDLALKVPVYLGTSDANLNRGAGAVTNAGFNNFAIAAHRDSYFRKLANIKKNQQIRVRNDDGTTEIYSVQDIIIVDPGDTQILNESATPTLTLITCYPFYYVGSAPQRYIVKAKLVNH